MSAVAAPEKIIIPSPNPALDPSRAPDDCSASEQAERFYRKALDALLAKATEQRQLETFVDCVAQALARVVVGLGNVYVSGDLLRRIGNYTCRLELEKQAQEEAAAASREGRSPH